MARFVYCTPIMLFVLVFYQTFFMTRLLIDNAVCISILPDLFMTRLLFEEIR